MEKIKLMLVSLSVLAVVGGALAFTSKTGTQFCYAEVAKGTICANVACPTLGKITVTTDPNIFLCTTPSVNGGCQLNGEDLPCGGNPVNWTVE